MAAPSQGKWEIVTITIDGQEVELDSKVTAIHAHLIPIFTTADIPLKAKVLYFHARYPSNYSYNDAPTPSFISYLYDPETKELTQYTIPRFPAPIGVDVDPSKLFCSGHTLLADGKLLVAGGERNQPPWGSNGTKYSFLFDSFIIDPENPNPWKFTQNLGSITIMTRGRWYPQLTKLHDGTVIVMSGYPEAPSTNDPPEYSVIIPERYDPVTQVWTPYSEMLDGLQIPLYNTAYVIPFGVWRGEIFYDMVAFGPELMDWKGAHRFNPFQTGSANYWNPVGSQSKTIRYHGCSVLLPIKSSDTSIRIINLGGFGSATGCEMIEIGNDVNTDWIPLPDLNYPRHDCPNTLLLADGSLITIGGGDSLMFVLVPEILDYSDPNPANWIWNPLTEEEAIMKVPRRYHSTALLLPDGRVWCGGSRKYPNPQDFEFENDMERRIEIYSPGYLFEGERPVIQVAPQIIHYGSGNEFEITLNIDSVPDMSVDSIVLISLPSVTHCFDSCQRYLILDFVIFSDDTYYVIPPNDGYIAPPGYYMLFVLRDKLQSNSGQVRIPSVAKIVKLEDTL